VPTTNARSSLVKATPEPKSTLAVAGGQVKVSPSAKVRHTAACGSGDPLADMGRSASWLAVRHLTFDFKYLKFLALWT
jgi:hypothetical protein